MKPFKTPILILATFDLLLPFVILGAPALEAAFPENCLWTDPNTRFPLCITPARTVFFLGIYAIMVLWPLTAVLIILSEVLGRRRARRLLDEAHS